MFGLILLKSSALYFAASSLPAGCGKSFFLLPHWYEYLGPKMDSSCNLITDPAIPNHFVMPGDLWLIGLAIIDILLRLAGIAAVVSIMYAGVSYMIAIGNADKITSSRKRIVNSVVGLVIVLTAAWVVSFIGHHIS